MYWIVRKLWLPILGQLLWWGWQAVDPPPAVQVAAAVAAMVGLAGAAKYLVHSTLHIDEAYRLAELAVLTSGWVGVLAIVALLTLNTPMIGLTAGAFLIYAALDAFPAVTRRLADVGRRIRIAVRFERVALRRDDPHWRPATVPTLLPRKPRNTPRPGGTP